MASRKYKCFGCSKSRYVMKENRIPIGKKKENLEKVELSKNNESELFNNQVLPKKKNLRTNKKANNDESLVLKIISINEAPTNTSLNKPIEKTRPKLSTIKELEEKALLSNVKTKLSSIQTKSIDSFPSTESHKTFKEISTKLVELQEKSNDVEEFNDTINDMVPNPQIPEVVLSPFVCTTRGQKWRPSPRKPPKLSERFAKYEDDNIADMYRKKLDSKTIELQNKIEYWTEFSSENGIKIPQSIKDEIDVVCGQTKLLTTDKFMQMRTLIEEFDNKSGSMPITTTDLDGFWDMLLLQVDKLEGQFSQLIFLKENNWTAIEPIAKKVLNKVSKANKRPEVKSKFADFLKNQKLKKIFNDNNSDKKNDDSNHFNEMKLSNNSCLFSSTPTSSLQKNSSFTPMLLKTMELSYVARRSGMTPIVLAKPHISPLKPALKNREQEKGTKRKNIHFESSKTTSNGFITHDNSSSDNLVCKKNSIKSRIVTPHTIKTFKVNQINVPIKSQNGLTYATKCSESNIQTNAIQEKTTTIKKSIGAQKTISVQAQKYSVESNVKSKKNTIEKTNEKTPLVATELTDTQIEECGPIRRSSRLANKPLKNYKC